MHLPNPKGMMKNKIFLALGIFFCALGMIGIVVPVLPTTPFLLLAAYFFGRSSERALHWMMHNRWLGAYVRNYREGRGIALRDKIFTLALLWLTILATVIFWLENSWLRAFLLLVATCVTVHLARTKTYRSQPTQPVAEQLSEAD